MKKTFLSILVFVMGGMMTLPTVEAQGRQGGNSQRSSQSVNRQRPGGSGSNNNTATRPGLGGSGNSNNNNTVTRPGNGGNNNNTVRPGGNSKPITPPATVNRPSRPSKPVTTPSRPSKPVVTRPGAVVTPRPVVVVPPTRPGRPIYNYAWSRPVPPSGWRPVYRHNLVSNILGLTFGLTINSALDHLYSGGYSIDGYGSQEVYLRNVTEMGYVWDDATLYFNSGGLVRSQFYDSSVGYNLSRYNNLYSQLVNLYGAPVSSSNGSATWFGYQGDYITLEYTQMNSSTGYRFFTVLTIGN